MPGINTCYYRLLRALKSTSSATVRVLDVPIPEGGAATAQLAPSRTQPVSILQPTLEEVLCSLPVLERTELACQWATSLTIAMRLAIAKALVSSVLVLGAGTVIEHLALDPDPEVRATACKAAWRRQPTMPQHYQEVLRGLVNDPRPEVRQMALLALGIRGS